jgi:secondary thiamine-phosphate synthase enzyme
MGIWQREIKLSAKPRGYHLIDPIIQNELPKLPETGVLHVFIKHTSAALTINENADPSVRVDFENSLNDLVKENQPYYTHTFEGSDDMPAHIKASLLGSSVSIPITQGKLNKGTWQGIYLCEFRNNASARSIVLSIWS